MTSRCREIGARAPRCWTLGCLVEVTGIFKRFAFFCCISWVVSFILLLGLCKRYPNICIWFLLLRAGSTAPPMSATDLDPEL
jgi:hypothetical protein